MKPDGVAQQERPSVRQHHLAHQRVQGHEQRVRGFGLRLRQAVEERRLAGIRVANERDRWHVGLVPAIAQLRAPAPDRVDLLLETVNAHADLPAIHFELGFTGTAGTDAAAEPGHLRAHADQPRQQVFQLGQFDLELALARAGTSREDVEDELGAIHYLALKTRAELPQLCGRELVVEDDDLDVGLIGRLGKQIHLAAAEKGGWIGPGPLLQHPQHNARAGGLGQPFQLFDRALGVEPPGRTRHQSHERGALTAPGTRSLHAKSILPRWLTYPRPLQCSDGWPPTPPSEAAPATGAAASTDRQRS